MKFINDFLEKHDDLLFRLTPQYSMKIMRKYFRLQVEGAEHIPKTGPAIIVPNHSGFSGFDAMVLAHEIYQQTGRGPKSLAHHLWFKVAATATVLKRLGFIEATFANGLKTLKEGKLIVLFPEGEHGNFKASTNAYELQEFKRGFVRMAIRTGAPIIPTMIIGAEESSYNLKQITFKKFLHGITLPLPLNLVPLPARWKIRFLSPIVLPYKPEAVADRELVREIAEDVRDQLQEAILKEIEKRDSVFL